MHEVTKKRSLEQQLVPVGPRAMLPYRPRMRKAFHYAPPHSLNSLLNLTLLQMQSLFTLFGRFKFLKCYTTRVQSDAIFFHRLLFLVFPRSADVGPIRPNSDFAHKTSYCFVCVVSSSFLFPPLGALLSAVISTTKLRPSQIMLGSVD
jgi:hypothetical protein